MAVHSHYENLKVSRTASAEEIRKSYRVLIQKYHPDKATDTDQKLKYEKIARMLNSAYAILADPVSRKNHDSWIEEEEYRSSSKNSSRYSKNSDEYFYRKSGYRSDPTEIFKLTSLEINKAICKALFKNIPHFEYFFKNEGKNLVSGLGLTPYRELVVEELKNLSYLLQVRNNRLENEFILIDYWCAKNLHIQSYPFSRYLITLSYLDPFHAAGRVLLCAQSFADDCLIFEKMGESSHTTIRCIKKHGIVKTCKMLKNPIVRMVFKLSDYFLAAGVRVTKIKEFGFKKIFD